MGDVSTESFGWATVEVVLDEAFSDWEYKLQGAVPSQLIMLGQDFKSGVDASIETKRLEKFLTTAGLTWVRASTTRNRWADSLTVNVFASVTQAFLDSQPVEPDAADVEPEIDLPLLYPTYGGWKERILRAVFRA